MRKRETQEHREGAALFYKVLDLWSTTLIRAGVQKEGSQTGLQTLFFYPRPRSSSDLQVRQHRGFASLNGLQNQQDARCAPVRVAPVMREGSLKKQGISLA